MLKRVTFVVFVLAFVVGVMLFRTSQDVRKSESQLRQLTAAIEQEKEAIRVLEAEWHYLNRPENLQAQAEEYLKMVPGERGHLARLSDIPQPMAPDVLPARRPDFVSAAPKQDVPDEKEEWLYPAAFTSGQGAQ